MRRLPEAQCDGVSRRRNIFRAHREHTKHPTDAKRPFSVCVCAVGWCAVFSLRHQSNCVSLLLTLLLTCTSSNCSFLLSHALHPSAALSWVLSIYFPSSPPHPSISFLHLFVLCVRTTCADVLRLLQKRLRCFSSSHYLSLCYSFQPQCVTPPPHTTAATTAFSFCHPLAWVWTQCHTCMWTAISSY